MTLYVNVQWVLILCSIDLQDVQSGSFLMVLTLVLVLDSRSSVLTFLLIHQPNQQAHQFLFHP